MANKIKHRGRFQAQGSGTEKSVRWAKTIPITKCDGLSSLIALEKKLTSKELSIRIECFNKAKDFVNRVPEMGITAPVKHSCAPFPPYKDVRVDIEVLSGIAFIEKI